MMKLVSNRTHFHTSQGWTVSYTNEISPYQCPANAVQNRPWTTMSMDSSIQSFIIPSLSLPTSAISHFHDNIQDITNIMLYRTAWQRRSDRLHRCSCSGIVSRPSLSGTLWALGTSCDYFQTVTRSCSFWLDVMLSVTRLLLLLLLSSPSDWITIRV